MDTAKIITVFTNNNADYMDSKATAITVFTNNSSDYRDSKATAIVTCKTAMAKEMSISKC